MQLERPTSTSGHLAKSALAGFLAVLLLGCCALSASPSLHEALHHDANSADHNCFITFFEKGHMTAAAVVQAVAVIAAFFGGIALLSDTLVPSSSDYCFSASRAPPASCRF
jgi:hypothetical protein